MNQGALGFPNQEPSARSFKVTGKPGATVAPPILAGGTTSGAPTTGRHVAREVVIDETGEGWYCTVGGTPGTWASMKGAGGGGTLRVEDEGSSVVAAATALNFAGAGVVVTDAGSNEALVTIAGSAVRAVTYLGDGGGNHTTTSATFADIHASLYDASIAAAAGDLLVIMFCTQWFHSAASNRCAIKFTVAGTVSTGMPTGGLFAASHDTNSNYDTFVWRHVVQSGEISGGNVAVVPQFATDAGTLGIRNDGTNGKPLFIVENWRQ